MMIKLNQLLREALDNPYKYSRNFTTHQEEVDDEDGENKYTRDVLDVTQIIKFKTDHGLPFIWYAKQSYYTPDAWNIAFGIDKGLNYKGAHELDINLTNKGDAFRILSTVIAITNSFIAFDVDYNEINMLIFTADSPKRLDLYLNRIVPKIEHFEIESVDRQADESTATLKRTSDSY